MILMAVPLLSIFAFPLGPMLYALGKAGAPLRAKIVASIAFFAALAPLCWEYGVAGAAMAFVLATAINVAIMMVQLGRQYRKLRSA